MREAMYDRLWRMGILFRNKAKQEGLLGPFDSILAHLGPILIPPPAHETQVSLPYGMKIVVPANYLSYRSLAEGLYEVDATKLLVRILRQGMTFVDVGAYIGYYTLLAAKMVGEAGRVYAFEPEEVNYSYLVRNVSSARLGNVVTVRKAAFNRTGKEEMVYEGAGERSRIRRNDGNVSVTRVDATTLDDFFANENWPPVDLVKMDIEGTEAFALEGMRELSRRNPRMLLIMEFNEHAMRGAGVFLLTIQNLLRELGFSVGYIIERNLKPFTLGRGLPSSNALHNFLLTKNGNNLSETK